MNPGRVTRSCMVCGSWQSMQATGCVTSFRASGVRHLVHLLEARDQVAPSELLVRHVDGGVAVHARARLLRGLLALGERLVVEHVGMAALLAEIAREGVSGPHHLQSRVFLEPRLRHQRSRIGGRRRARHRLAPAIPRSLLVHRPDVAVVLKREVLSPDRRVRRLIGQLDDAVEGIPGLLLPLEDVDEQRRDGDRRDGGQDDNGDGPATGSWRLRGTRQSWVHFSEDAQPSDGTPRMTTAAIRLPADRSRPRSRRGTSGRPIP